MKPSPSVVRAFLFVSFVAILCTWFSAPALAQTVQVTSADPPAAEQGTVSLDVTVKGKGFKQGAQAQWFVTGTTNPGGVTVNSTTFVSGSELRANITVADDATIAQFDILVTNTSNGRSGKGTELFSVVAKGSGIGSCTSDVPLKAIFAPGFANGGTARIYGDSDNGTTANTYFDSADLLFNGGSVYTDGVDGVYAQLQVCNGTNDFILNLGQSKKRSLNFDFSVQLTAPDPRAIDVSGQTLQEGFLNLNQVANDALYVNGQLDTCMGSTLYGGFPKAHPARMLFHNPALLEGTPLTGVEGCGDLRTSLANDGGNTAVIQVQHVDACTWIITSVGDATTGWHRGGLVEDVRRVGTISGGQYHMPFAIKLSKLSCQ